MSGKNTKRRAKNAPSPKSSPIPVSKSSESPRVIDRQAHGPNSPQSVLEREVAFARRYVVDRNGTRAVLECGGYNVGSRGAAGAYASALLKRPSVQALIKAEEARKQSYLKERYEVTGDRILREMATIGFSNMNDYVGVNEEGQPFLDFSLLKDPVRGEALGAAIQKIESEVYHEYNPADPDDPVAVKRTKFQLYDKRSMLLELGKACGDPRFQGGLDPTQNPQFVAQQMQITVNQVKNILFRDIIKEDKKQ